MMILAVRMTPYLERRILMTAMPQTRMSLSTTTQRRQQMS